MLRLDEKLEGTIEEKEGNRRRAADRVLKFNKETFSSQVA